MSFQLGKNILEPTITSHFQEIKRVYTPTLRTTLQNAPAKLLLGQEEDSCEDGPPGLHQNKTCIDKWSNAWKEARREALKTGEIQDLVIDVVDHESIYGL